MPETFRFLALEWDIDAAKALVTDRQPNATCGITDESMLKLFGDPPPAESELSTSPGWQPITFRLGMVDVDRERAMTAEIDLEIPIIGAMILPSKDGEPIFLVLDGHHRLYKAWKEGRTSLDMHLLTTEEELSLRTWRSVKPAGLKPRSNKRQRKTTPGKRSRSAQKNSAS